MFISKDTLRVNSETLPHGANGVGLPKLLPRLPSAIPSSEFERSDEAGGGVG